MKRNAPKPKIQYTKLNEGRVLVTADRPGKPPLKTVVEVAPPEEQEVEAAVASTSG